MRAIIGSWLLLGFSGLAIAANGSIDSTFGVGGYALTGLTDATFFNGASLTLPRDAPCWIHTRSIARIAASQLKFCLTRPSPISITSRIARSAVDPSRCT